MPSPGPWGLFSGGLAGTIDNCKITHLDTGEPCWWSVSGLAKSYSEGCRAGEKVFGETGAVGVPLAHRTPSEEEGREEQREAGLKPLQPFCLQPT